MEVNAYDLAARFVGMKEVGGTMSHPLILQMLRIDTNWVEDDETPWCSAFANYPAWLLRLPRSYSLAARSWLGVGQPVRLIEAAYGFDVVVLSRGENQPGPDVLEAPGHVGYFSSLEGDWVWILGGNQGDRVSLAPYPRSRVLGVRRLA